MATRKVQGEGDYESARRFRKQEGDFVKAHASNGKPVKGDARKANDELTPAEKKGRARAKAVDQDQRDARKMDELEKKKRRR